MSKRKTTRRVRADAEALAEAFAHVQRQRAARTTTRPTGGSVVYRCRRQLAPHAIAAGLATAGGVGHLAAAAAPDGLLVVASVATVTFGLVAAGAAVLRPRIDRGRRRWAGLCALTGAGWVTLAAAVGLTWGTVALLLAVEYALAARWWRRHRILLQGAVTLPERVRVPTATAELWAAHVANKGGALEGAALTHREDTEHGESYTVQLVPGRQYLSLAQGALPRISSGLRRPMDEIVLEAHPGWAGKQDPSQLRLQVITRSPIKATVLFDRPRYTDGRILLGPYADGVGEATYRLYTANSMWGGFALGGTGSGKSRLLEGIGVTCRATGHTVVFYLDGQDGASSPTLWRHATWAGGTEDASAMLAAIERIMRMRQKYNRAHGLAGFTPSAGMPGVLVVIDECHAIFADKNVKRWGHVARAGRKVGMAILAASQHYGLDTFGGAGGDVLRSSLLAGNGLALRTTSRIAGQLMPGLALDPAELPALPGYGYSIAAPGSDGRTAPFRGRYLPDAADKAAVPELAVPTVEEWFELLGDVELDAMSAHAAGEVFLRRHEHAETRRAALLAEITAVATGELGAEEELDQPEPAAAPAGGYGQVVAFPGALGANLHAVGAAGSAELTDPQALVYRAVASGATRPAQLVEVLEVGERRVRQLLGELVDAGHLTKTGHGRYAPAGDDLDDTA